MITTVVRTFVGQDGDSVELALSEQDLREARKSLLRGKATKVLEMSPLNKVAGSEFQAVDRSWIIEAHLDGFELLLVAQRTNGRNTWLNRFDTQELPDAFRC